MAAIEGLRARAVALLALPMMSCGATSGPVRHDVSIATQVYADSQITVVSPSVRDEVSIGERGSAVASYVADVVSGATRAVGPDVVTSATRFAEERHQVGLGGEVALSTETAIGAQYLGSYESDHVTHAPSVRASTELLDRRLEIGASYGVSFETVGRAGDSHFAAETTAHSFDLSAMTLLSPRTTLTVLLSGALRQCASQLGCQANPYRYVRVGGSWNGATVLAERHPDTRVSGAAAVRWAQALSDDVALHVGYRATLDSFRVAGLTLDATLAASLFSEQLELRARVRGTAQSAASFALTSYDSFERSELPSYRTSDPELSQLYGVSIGGRAGWKLSDAGPLSPLRVSVRVEHLRYYYYPQMRSLREREGWVLGIVIDGRM